jgi:DNA repair protein RecN (Recombination protein N)
MFPDVETHCLMLNLLNISNIALIGEMRVDFDRGLNLLTGETGSGKSILVDALGILIGGRFSSEMLKAGEARGFIEGLFTLQPVAELKEMLESAGIEMDRDELIIRRELSTGGRNKIFINNRLATQSVLRDLRPFLVDIHGQGDQQTLLNPDTHLDLLDSFAGFDEARSALAERYNELSAIKHAVDGQRRDEAERFQLIDILRFQIDELERASIMPGEDERLEEEKRRLANIEKLLVLCSEGFSIVYEESDSGIARIVQTLRRVEELAEYEGGFRGYIDGLETARALLEDLAFMLRDYGEKLEFSPDRLAEIESRLAEISRLKRKYGGTSDSAARHLEKSRERLQNLEMSDQREKDLREQYGRAMGEYLEHARRLHRERIRAAKKFEGAVERSLAEVAMENSRLEVRLEVPTDSELAEVSGPAWTGRLGIGPRGIDRAEFHFSANPGEPLRPLAKVASGGEASRLMLVLKTITNASRFPRTIVFDEIDAGIGGRVSEAVGAKLKRLSETNQVLCVTHQPQIARFADSHLLIRKGVADGRTEVSVERLDRRARIEEIARMLTGADITESARRHAREMLKTV